MTVTHQAQATTGGPRLHLAFELSWTQWKLAFTIGHGQPARLRTIAARDLSTLLREITRAKRRFGLPNAAPVVSCYEAGRDGFWLHRWLTSQGIANVIVDSASIEVSRRKRRAKSDRLDAAKLVSMLLRYHAGETRVWSVVRVPEAADEDRRQLHRELMAVQDERTEHTNRIKGFLAGQGIALAQVTAAFPALLATLRCWDGAELGPDLKQRLLREFARWQLADQQVKELELERKRRLRRDDTPHVERLRRLLGLAGIGLSGSWLLVFELFGWRHFGNRRQVGAIAGLTPTPYQSGDDNRAAWRGLSAWRSVSLASTYLGQPGRGSVELVPGGVPGAQPGGAADRQGQAVPPHRDSVRQTQGDVPCVPPLGPRLYQPPKADQRQHALVNATSIAHLSLGAAGLPSNRS
jgi:transposase